MLNSRQGKTPVSDAPWLRMTIDLCGKLVESDAAVISSIGMGTWELVTWKVGSLGGNLILVVPDISPEMVGGMSENIIRDFGLSQEKVLMLYPAPEAKPEQKYQKFPKRDFWIAALADRMYPVSIRSNGNLSRIVELYSIVPDRVVEKFRIEYEKTRPALFHPSQLPELSIAKGTDWEYLTHYTRTSLNPWPGETKAEYYSSLAEVESGYSHDAYNTLKRILLGGKLAASSELIRGGFDVVSLTECSPWEIAGLIKWRKRMLRWTFEPYGIALSKAKLLELGVRIVYYGFDYQYRFLSGGDRAFFQMNDPRGNDWRAEREWRFLGDLDLAHFGPDEAKALVLKPEEAEELNEFSPFPVICWQDIGGRMEDDENIGVG